MSLLLCPNLGSTLHQQELCKGSTSKLTVTETSVQTARLRCSRDANTAQVTSQTLDQILKLRFYSHFQVALKGYFEEKTVRTRGKASPPHPGTVPSCTDVALPRSMTGKEVKNHLPSDLTRANSHSHLLTVTQKQTYQLMCSYTLYLCIGNFVPKQSNYTFPSWGYCCGS